MTVFRVLCEYGRADLAFKMITRTDYPSFGCWVKRGYTALAENFHPDGEFPDSLNHHCFGEISAIFIEYFAGIKINPYKDDCKEVNIEPCFVPELSQAQAFYETVSGNISVNWERKGATILLAVEKPDDVYGEIKLPDGYVFKNSSLPFVKYQSGEYVVEKKGAPNGETKSNNIIEV
jgi:alpha-L-rhamnosidase